MWIPIVLWLQLQHCKEGSQVSRFPAPPLPRSSVETGSVTVRLWSVRVRSISGLLDAQLNESNQEIPSKFGLLDNKEFGIRVRSNRHDPGAIQRNLYDSSAYDAVKKLFLVLIILWSGVQVPGGPPHTSRLNTTAYGKPWAVFFWGHQRTMDFGESFGMFSLVEFPLCIRACTRSGWCMHGR